MKLKELKLIEGGEIFNQFKEELKEKEVVNFSKLAMVDKILFLIFGSSKRKTITSRNILNPIIVLIEYIETKSQVLIRNTKQTNLNQIKGM